MTLNEVTKLVRSVLVSGVVLSACLILAGAAYTLWVSRNTSQSTAPQAPTQQASSIIPKPHPPSPNAPEGVAVEAMNTPAQAGSQGFISVRTNPGSTCTIKVTYSKITSKAAGLSQQVADSYGSASWTWTIDESAPIGTWPVQVTCAYRGRTGMVIADLQIIK